MLCEQLLVALLLELTVSLAIAAPTVPKIWIMGCPSLGCGQGRPLIFFIRPWYITMTNLVLAATPEA